MTIILLAIGEAIILALYFMLSRSQKKTGHVLFEFTNDGLKTNSSAIIDLQCKAQRLEEQMLQCMINFQHLQPKEEPAKAPKKGANRRPRTEAEKAQQAQIKKDWWAKKKAQQQNAAAPKQAISEGKPS